VALHGSIGIVFGHGKKKMISPFKGSAGPPADHGDAFALHPGALLPFPLALQPWSPFSIVAPV